MQKPQTPKNEKARQAALDSYSILDSLPEKAFDDFSLIASLICQTPIALVSLVDNDRQWFKSKHGLSANETHRDISFCGHAINNPQKIFEIQNAKTDERFTDNPLVIGDLNIGFYAGVPLVDGNNYALGTLCVIGHEPKTLSKDQKRALTALANEVMNHIELGKKSKELTSTVKVKNQAIAESQKNYRKLYNDAPDMMASIQAKTKKIIDCNSMLSKELGYQKKEILGENLMMLYHEDCHTEVEKVFKTYAKKGEVKNHRLILRKKNGDKINVGLNVKAIKDKDGNILHSNSVWRNIDKIIQDEQVLLQSNFNLEKVVKQRTTEIESHKERLELALKGTNDGIWDWKDLDAHEQWWSPRYYELLGYKDGEIESNIDSFSKKLLHPNDETRLWKSFNDCLKKDIPMNNEFRLKTKAGKYKWFRGKANVIRDENDKGIRIAGSISDINKQKLLELKLKETERFLTKVTEIAPTIIYIYNHKTKLNEFTNKEIASVLGYSIREVKTIGDKLISSLCHPEDLNKVIDHFKLIKSLPDQVTLKIEYRMKRKDSTYKWILSEDTVFERNKKGEVLKHIGVAIDITELKEAAEKLQQQKEKLADQNKDLKQFAYVATHDLKNPILTLAGHFDYLKDKITHPDVKSQESIEFIEEEIKIFNDTLSGLNKAIKIRENAVEIVAMDLNKQIIKVSAAHLNQIEQLNGKLSLNLTEDKLILGTQLYIQSILNNLISNCIKYRREEELLAISISTIVEGDKLKLSVADNGLGIDLKLHKDRLFKMFNRFHLLAEGNGMGLYMVKQMVEKLDGSIHIKSKVNKGTEISLLLKLAQ